MREASTSNRESGGGMEWSRGTNRAEIEAVSSVVVAVVGSTISFDATVVISVVEAMAAAAGAEIDEVDVVEYRG